VWLCLDRSRRSVSPQLAAGCKISAVMSTSQSFARLVLAHWLPTLVRPRYFEYQLYDSLQGLCSYPRRRLQRTAKSRVRWNEATAMSAALT
jgi:hypothetical protein